MQYFTFRWDCSSEKRNQFHTCICSRQSELDLNRNDVHTGASLYETFGRLMLHRINFTLKEAEFGFSTGIKTKHILC
jgi:hypothetical protein